MNTYNQPSSRFRFPETDEYPPDVDCHIGKFYHVKHV